MSGSAKWLARETARDDPIASREVGASDGSDIAKRLGVREAGAIDSDCIRVHLRKVVLIETHPGPMGAEGEAAYSRE
jgi:putative heme degradation protein